MKKIIRRPLRPAPPGTLPPVVEAPRPPAPPPRDWTEAELPVPRGKRLVSLRIDADVLDYFQGGGKGYQTRMNAVLRAWMEARQRRSGG